MTATPQTELESRLTTLAKSAGRVETDDGYNVEPLTDAADAELIEDFIAAYNPDDLIETPPPGESTLATGTLNIYLSRLIEAARHFTLGEAITRDVNGFLQGLQDAGRAEETINGYSTALRSFFTYYDGDVDPDDIARVKRSNGSTFDPDDVLTREEIQAMLDAADSPRDRAVFALLIYTGMRNNALRTLRIKDVDVQAGTWQFNDDAEGLKEADKNGQTRPLLGARGPVRDWLNYHPYKDDPDALLVCAKPRYIRSDDDPYKPVEGSTVRRIVNDLAEATGDPAIQAKPTHPHTMRRNFVTVCKRDYELPDETVKFLIGHAKGSTVMETTYSHLSDADHIERAEAAAGLRDPADDGEPFTPQACPICGDPLPPDAKACTCGHVFAPDAKAVQDAIQDDMKDDYRDTDPEPTPTRRTSWTRWTTCSTTRKSRPPCWTESTRNARSHPFPPGHARIDRPPRIAMSGR